MSNSYSFTLDDFKIPSKSNCYTIRFAPAFWHQIAHFARAMGRPYWIAPTDEVKTAQEVIALQARVSIRAQFTGEVELNIAAYGAFDADNALKIILDSLQDAGIVKNDRQVRKITIERDYTRKRSGFACTVREI